MTPGHRTPRALRLPAALVVLASLLVACGGAAARTPAPTQPGVPSVTPTPVPGAPGNGGLPGDGGSGSGGSGGANGGNGGGVAPPPPGGGGGIDPTQGQPTWVTPVAGQLDPHPVNVQLVRASADGRHVTVELRWWSGIAPCSVLDSVTVATDADAHTVTLTANEGAGGVGVACIEIAQLKATTVDLGELAAGSWTIGATGDAAPVTIDLR